MAETNQKLRALFVHGYKGDSTSGTGRSVKEALSDRYDFVIPDFDLENPEATLEKIRSVIEAEKISAIFGTSLGSFYVLSAWSKFPELREKLSWTIVNPCMIPSSEIPILAVQRNDTVAEKTLASWKELESAIGEIRGEIHGYFADNDELFQDKYWPLFRKISSCELIVFSGGHHGYNPALVKKVAETHCMSK